MELEFFPVEIKEIIVSYCHGETLLNLRLVNKLWKKIVDNVDERKKLFKKCIKQDTYKHQMKDVAIRLYPNRKLLNQHSWMFRNIYASFVQWKTIDQRIFIITRLSPTFVNITALKTSRFTVIVGDKNGIHMINLKTGACIPHGIGPVKHIKLVSIAGKHENKEIHYGFDEVDVITQSSKHYYYNLRHQDFVLLRCSSEYDNTKYWCFQRLKVRDGSCYHSIKLYDFFEENFLFVTGQDILVIKPSSSERTKFDSEGARAWFAYHSKMVLCAKDETLTAFLDGNSKIWRFHSFPPITAMMYYAGWFFFASKYGAVYGYRCRVEEIFTLALENYELVWQVCNDPIGHIDVIEDEYKTIVIATDKDLYTIAFGEDWIHSF